MPGSPSLAPLHTPAPRPSMQDPTRTFSSNSQPGCRALPRTLHTSELSGTPGNLQALQEPRCLTHLPPKTWHPLSQLLKHLLCVPATARKGYPQIPITIPAVLPRPQSRNPGIHPDYWPDSVTPKLWRPGAHLPTLISFHPISRGRSPDKASHISSLPLQSPLTYQTRIESPLYMYTHFPSWGQALD